jgi:hypothetical protein
MFVFLVRGRAMRVIFVTMAVGMSMIVTALMLVFVFVAHFLSPRYRLIGFA